MARRPSIDRRALFSMDLLAILRTLRRHWVLILALTVVGAAVGVATAAFDAKTTKSRTFYKATTTLVVDLTNQSTGASATPNGFQSLDQVAIYTTTGDVPDLVAKQLGTDESGRQLAEHVITTTNSGTSTIAITAAEPTADEARRTADTFAVELVANLDQRGQNAYAQARDRIQGRLDDITKQKNALFAQTHRQPAEPRHDPGAVRRADKPVPHHVRLVRVSSRPRVRRPAGSRPSRRPSRYRSARPSTTRG